MRMHSSDLFRINQRKGWPQREQFTNTVSDAGKPFYQEKKENTHFNSVFCLRVLVVLVPLMTWGWEGVVEVGILPQNLRKCLVSPLARQHWVCVLHVAEKSSQLFSHYIICANSNHPPGQVLVPPECLPCPSHPRQVMVPPHSLRVPCVCTAHITCHTLPWLLACSLIFLLNCASWG